MKLMELTGIKHLKDKSPKELIAYLQDQFSNGKTSIKFLGKGMNGVAFTDGETVFKFWHRDSGYETFINYCEKNKGNPFLPKLFSKVKTLPFSVTTSYRGKTVTGLKFIRMEKLEEMKRSPKFKLYKHDDLEVGLSDILFASDGETPEKFLKELIESYAIYNRKEPADIPFHPDDISDDVLLLAKTYREISEITHNDNKKFVDLGGDNIMQRENGQMVFVDPLADSVDLDFGIDLDD